MEREGKEKRREKGRRRIFFSISIPPPSPPPPLLRRKKLVMSLSVTEAVDVATCDRFMLEGRKLGQRTMEQRR